MIEVSFARAKQHIWEHIAPLNMERRLLDKALGYVVAQEVYALLDVPGKDVSLKDGFAVRSADIIQASAENPVSLRLVGEVFAGGSPQGEVGPGEAVRVTSGALLPAGADAVLAEEFAQIEGTQVWALAQAERGRNVLRRGEDIARGELILPRGSVLYPPDLGLLASAGHTEVTVYRRPRVLVVATGDEIIPVGQRVTNGKVVASNLVTIYTWLRYFGLPATTRVVRDEERSIRQVVEEFLASYDVLLTSGGAWKGERDLVIKVLDQMGWQKVFHRVRLGPGKAVAFGLFGLKPVFCLPGGPPSNQAAFFLLALPGLLRCAGFEKWPFPEVHALLEEELAGEPSWTQVFLGRLKPLAQGYSFSPLKPRSRLQYLSEAEGLVLLPEGKEKYPPGTQVSVKIIKPQVLKKLFSE